MKVLGCSGHIRSCTIGTRSRGSSLPWRRCWPTRPSGRSACAGIPAKLTPGVSQGGLSVADVVTDVILCIELEKTPHTWWFLITLTILLLGPVIVSVPALFQGECGRLWQTFRDRVLTAGARAGAFYRAFLSFTHLDVIATTYELVTGGEREAKRATDNLSRIKVRAQRSGCSRGVLTRAPCQLLEAVYEAVPEALFQAYVVCLVITTDTDVGEGDLIGTSTFAIVSLVLCRCAATGTA